MHTFKFTILTPQKSLFSEEIISTVIPTQEGEVTILANHVPMISVMSIGEVRVKMQNGDERKFDLQGGVLEVKDHNSGVVLMSDLEITTEDINLEDLQKEIDRAKEAMKEKVDENIFADLEGSLERNLYLRKVLSKRK